MKKCPFCAEEIQADAIKCKHCGSMLVAGAPAVVAPAKPDRSWMQMVAAVFALFGILSAFVLPVPIWMAVVFVAVAIGFYVKA